VQNLITRDHTARNLPDPAYLRGMVSVVVPAHNEAQVLGRLLGQLAPAGTPDDVDVIVVANGCTDDTAQIAGGHGPRVRVLSIPVPSKREALLAGDQAATSFPRIYVDADVEIGLADIRALAGALARPGALAAGPERVLALSGASWLVRWYYDVWARLPEVRSGLFGRGSSRSARRVMRGSPACRRSSRTTSRPPWSSGRGSGSSCPARASSCTSRGPSATCSAAESGPPWA